MLDYPKTYQENIEFRADLLIRAEHNKLLQDSIKEACRQDRLFFFNVLAWTYNPRKEISHLPFITYPFQDDTITWDAISAKMQQDNLVEKSRDMGATWMFVVNDFYDWLFCEEKIEIKWGSRKETYVDEKGNMDSIFEKFRYLYRNLPLWIMPKEWNVKENDNYMRLINPETKSSITGESTNANFGRGGRKYRIRFDEFAFWECFSKDTEVLTDNGWSLIEDVSLDDKVYSMNPETEQAEYMPVIAKQKKFYKELIHFNSKSVDLMVSPNHNMLVKKRHKVSRKGFKQLYFKTAKRVANQKHDYIPLVSNNIDGDYPVKINGFASEDWMEFLGWYVSEGHISDKPRSRKLGISQSKEVNPDKVDQISKLLKRMGFKVKYYGHTFVINKPDIAKDIWEELLLLGKAGDKHINNKYLLLHKDLLSILVETLMKGDGTRVERVGRVDKMAYFTTSKLLAGQVQILLQKVGLRGSIIERNHSNEAWNKCYVVNVGFKKNAQVCALSPQIVEYNDMVYCVTTPYHTLYVRRNGIASWCGNCDDSAWSACADSTNCRTALSTPNGSSNKFAILAKSKIRKVSLHWTKHPEKNIGAYYFNMREKIPVDVSKDKNRAYDLWLMNRDRLAPEPYIGSFMRSTWYDMECNRRGKAKEVAQELDIDYHMSGSPFFNLRMLDKQRIWTLIERNIPSHIIPEGKYVRAIVVESDQKWTIRETSAGWLKVYEYPKPGGQYIVSGDTAEGLEKSDETVGIVQEKYTGNVIAVFNGQFTPDDHAHKLFQVAKLYNNSKIAPENNNHGYSVCSDLKQLDCDLYWTFKEDDKTKVRTPVKAGFTTNAQSRPIALDQMAEGIEKETIELRDEDLINQCRTFINNPKGKPEADGSFLDDLIMAKAIGCQVIKDYPYKIPKPKNRRAISEQPKNAGFGFND